MGGAGSARSVTTKVQLHALTKDFYPPPLSRPPPPPPLLLLLHFLLSLPFSSSASSTSSPPPRGAVAADGRVKPGDLILKVNEVEFANLNNEEAVKVLREVVQQSGPITLVVARPTYDPVEDLAFNARGKEGGCVGEWVCVEEGEGSGWV